MFESGPELHRVFVLELKFNKLDRYVGLRALCPFSHENFELVDTSIYDFEAYSTAYSTSIKCTYGSNCSKLVRVAGNLGGCFDGSLHLLITSCLIYYIGGACMRIFFNTIFGSLCCVTLNFSEKLHLVNVL